MPAPVRICFVCLGNICRSPTAEGVFRHLVAKAGLESAYQIDSAGTAAHHTGEPPDRRAAATARARGFRLEGAARRFEPEDFARFDHVVAMDLQNRSDLISRAPDQAARDKVTMLRDWDPQSADGSEVPDPYYGGDAGFERVFDICVAGCTALLEATRPAS